MTKASYRDANGLGGHGRDLDLALYFTGGPRRLYGWTRWIEEVEQLGTPSDGLHPSKGVLLV